MCNNNFHYTVFILHIRLHILCFNFKTFLFSTVRFCNILGVIAEVWEISTKTKCCRKRYMGVRSLESVLMSRIIPMLLTIEVTQITRSTMDRAYSKLCWAPNSRKRNSVTWVLFSCVMVTKNLSVALATVSTVEFLEEDFLESAKNQR